MSAYIIYINMKNNNNKRGLSVLDTTNLHAGSVLAPSQPSPHDADELRVPIQKKLDGFYVSGFSDAESCFVIKIAKSNKTKTGWRIDPVFEIGLNVKDLALLKRIQSFFGVGTIRTNERNNSVVYAVQSIKELMNVVIPHFIKYPLLTQKQGDFELFKKALIIMNCKEHVNQNGLQEVVNLRASMNNGLSSVLKDSFPNTKPVQRPIVELVVTPDPNWLTGFVDGEGCFLVNASIDPRNSNGYLVGLRFSICQNSRDLKLMENLKTYLGCGYIVHTKKNTVEFVVTKFADIQEKIIPFFQANSLQGIKVLNYLDFKKVADLIKDKVHLTSTGLDQVQKIKAGMNNGRIKFTDYPVVEDN